MKPTKENNYLIPYASGGVISLTKNAKLRDTLKALKENTAKYAWQAKGLAEFLYDPTIEGYCRNIWHFVKKNFPYREDEKNKEQLRTLSHSWYFGRYTGIDCDCYSFLISQLLRCYPRHISHDFRVVCWEEVGKFQHIYPVAYDEQGNLFAIDCIPEIPRFNYQLKYVDKMDLEVLNGAGDLSEDQILSQSITVSGVPAFIDEDTTIAGISDEALEGPEQEELLSLAGWEETYDEDPEGVPVNGANLVKLNTKDVHGSIAQAYRALRHQKMISRFKNKPASLAGLVDLPNEYNFCVKIISAWPHEGKRENALKHAINNSQFSEFYKGCLCQLRQNEHLKDLNTRMVKTSSDTLLLGYDDDEDQDLGKAKKNKAKKAEKKKARKEKIKKAIKKIGNSKVVKLVKKIKNKILKVTPAMIIVRNGLLLAAKNDFQGFASKLKIGYYSEEQAKQKGISLDEYRDVKNRLAKLEKKFESVGGNKDNLKKAILGGKAGPLNGSLGVAPVIGAAVAKIIQAIMKGIKAAKDRKAAALNAQDQTVPEATPYEESQAQEQSLQRPAFDAPAPAKTIQKLPVEDTEEAEDKSAADTSLSSTKKEQMETTQTTTASSDTPVKDERGFFKREWEERKWWWIGGTLGLILLIILVIWMVGRGKKRTSLNGRRRRRKTTYSAPRPRRRRKAPVLNGPMVLAGRKRSPAKRKPAATKKKKKKSRR